MRFFLPLLLLLWAPAYAQQPVASQLATTSAAAPHWMNNLQQAQQQAKDQGRYVLLNFSGSDWCGPCIRLKKEVFASQAFQQLASERLVLLNADFPRLKKNKLAAEQLAANEDLAQRYNPEGQFPCTVLLNADGKVLKTWVGFPAQGIDAWVRELAQVVTPHP